MGYFNINSIFYNLRKIFKYLSFSLLIVAFVVLALLLIGKDVHAAIGYPDNNGVPDISDNLLDKAIEFYESSNFDSYFVIRTDSNTYGLILFNNLNDNTFYVNTDGPSSNNIYWLKCIKQDNITTEFYSLTENGTNVSINYELNSLKFGVGAYRYKIKGIYSSNNNVYYAINIDGAPNLNNPMYLSEIPIADPIFENYEDTEHFGNTLVNGEFTYFYFKIPHVKDPFTPFWFYFHDITDVPIPSDDYYNGSTSVFINLNDAVSNSVGLNYLYRYLTKDGYDYYAVPSVSPFGSYLNGHTYRLVLEWTYDSGVTADSKSFQWTTDFSQAGITKQDENKNDAMLSGINSLYKSQQEMNNFLNDNSYNSNNIINNMPNSNQYTSPTDSGIDSIFTALYNAFTTNQTQNVRFVIPFTNDQYIDIPSDLVTSRLPQVIIILIQSVYWYIICRYIVKDIASIAEKAKSGEILDGSSDGNIKTDLL